MDLNFGFCDFIKRKITQLNLTNDPQSHSFCINSWTWVDKNNKATTYNEETWKRCWTSAFHDLENLSFSMYEHNNHESYGYSAIQVDIWEFFFLP